MSLDSHSRRHSLDDPLAESSSSAPHPPSSSCSFAPHSSLLEQRRPTMASHGQSLSWSGPGDTYPASRQQQDSYSFPSAFRQQQQQQPPAHPLASLMLGGDVAPRTPLDYNSYYTSASSSVAAQHEPRTRDWGPGRQSGGGAGVDGDTDSHVFENWEDSSMVKEEDEGQDWGEYREEEQRGGWDVAEVDEGQQQWAPSGSEQPLGQGYEAYSTRQRFNNPYPSPYEPSAELPPLPALSSAYGTPPQSSSSFTPSSLPIGNQYIHQHTPFTPQYSTQSLSLSAPEARSYPSFSSFGEFSPTTTAAAQVLYEARPMQQQQHQFGTPFRSSRPQNLPRAFTSSSVGGQGSLLAPMLEMHHSPTSTSITSSPVFEDYNHPMSMSPRSPISPLELPHLPLPSLGDDDDRYSPDLAPRISPSSLATNRSPPNANAKPVQRRKRGSLPKEIDAKSGRPISPITGLPTKVIAKRGWPPKDMAKRVYTCPFEGCDRIFGRPSARETHIRSHNGIQPFTCPISSCRRPFSVFSNLKRHMIVHPTVDFRSVTVNDLPHIHCVETEQGPMLEWDDAEEGEEEFGPAACRSGGEGEEREELEGLGEGEGEELDWRGREGDVGRRSLD